MAKDQWHNWGRYILLAVVIIFGSGGWMVTVQSNTNDIGILRTDTKVLKENFHKLELDNKDITNMTQQSLNQWLQVGIALKAIQDKQAEQNILLDRNTIKLETLTRD